MDGLTVGCLEGKVALVTGAARGQGRSLAATFACEGANVIAIDACTGVADLECAPASELEENVRLVRKTGRRSIAYETDVRDLDGLVGAATRGAEQLGSLDIVVANAGVVSWSPL